MRAGEPIPTPLDDRLAQLGWSARRARSATLAPRERAWAEESLRALWHRLYDPLLSRLGADDALGSPEEFEAFLDWAEQAGVRGDHRLHWEYARFCETRVVARDRRAKLWLACTAAALARWIGDTWTEPAARIALALPLGGGLAAGVGVRAQRPSSLSEAGRLEQIRVALPSDLQAAAQAERVSVWLGVSAGLSEPIRWRAEID